MWGFQNFPTKIESLNLNKINLLKQNFSHIIGYADHTDSNDYLNSFSIPLLAFVMGANIVEKHITLNRFKKKNDYYSSLNPDEFEKFVKFLKKSSQSLGNNQWILSKVESAYNAFSKKYLVAKKNISKNEFLNKSNITFKRTGKIGISIDEFNFLKKPKLSKDMKKDKPIFIKNLIK